MNKTGMIPFILFLTMNVSACEDSTDTKQITPSFDLGLNDSVPRGDRGITPDLPRGDRGITPDLLGTINSSAEFCEAFAAVRCEGIFKCCATASEMFESQATCQTAYDHICNVTFKREMYDSHCRSFVAAAAQDYVQSRITAVSNCSFPEPHHVAGITSVFKGSRTLGGDCRNDPEGGSWSQCCAPEFYCDQEVGSDSRTCQPLKEADTPCIQHQKCNTDLYCPYLAPAEDSKCTPKLPNGQPCDIYGAGSCLSGSCGDDELCAEPKQIERPDYHCEAAIPNCVRLWASEPTDTACELSWDCTDQIYSVKCAADQNNWACDCAVNSVVQKSFTSTNFCKADPADHKTIAETGCGWEFPKDP